MRNSKNCNHGVPATLNTLETVTQ